MGKYLDALRARSKDKKDHVTHLINQKNTDSRLSTSSSLGLFGTSTGTFDQTGLNPPEMGNAVAEQALKPLGELHSCNDCARLSPTGICKAALSLGAMDGYKPVLGRRFDHYCPEWTIGQNMALL